MAKTKRSVPKSSKWDIEFRKKLERGQVKIPKAKIGKDGKKLRDEVWGEAAKKLRKKLINKNRRKGGYNDQG